MEFQLGLFMKRSELAHDVKMSLKRLPPPFASHYGVVPAPPPENGVAIGKALSSLTAAHAAMQEVDTIAARMLDPYLISRILTRREAVSSSAIEGTNSTLDELLAVEEGDDESKAQARQVRDYALVLEDALPQAKRLGDEIFSLELIQRLHADIMRGDEDYRDAPGVLRSTVVWIGGGKDIAYSIWNPPPPDEVQPCIMQTVDYLRNEGMQSVNQSLVVRMAIAHAHFEAVHPFRDGNGRVGRLLLPLMMASAGKTPLYLSPYIDVHKNEYYAALKEAQQKLNWSAMIEFVADAIVGSARELMATRDALMSLVVSWSARRRFRRGSAAFRALDILPHYPVLTIRRMAKLLDVSFRQASEAAGQLEKVGILTERTGYARNRIFAATEVLSIVNRPFGYEPAGYEPDT
jgi:Fic family protein